MSNTPARIAIVTGAAQGLGYSIAVRLAADGLDVAVNDIAGKTGQLEVVAEEIRKLGRRSIVVPADVSSEEEVKGMVDTVVRELGGLDVMIANAGISAPITSFLDTSVQQWDRIWAVNVQGSMLCYKYASIQMIQQGRGGRIIGASSSAGKKGTPNLSAYSASKFALRGFTQSVAEELAKHNITVNAYAPGLILTPLAEHPDDAINGGLGTTVKKLFGYPQSAPDASAEVVASIVSHLVKPESHFITGQTISVDGGLVLD